MITENVDLELNSNEFNEHLFVFIFFAANAIIEASVTFLFFKHKVKSQAERRWWTAVYMMLSFLYFICNLCFMHILQRIWSHKNNSTYEDPILAINVPMVVYIKNRRLFRVQRENRYNDSK